MSASEATTSAESGAERHPEERKVRRAIAQIRREGWKVAVIYGTIDAALVTLVVNLVAAGVGGVPSLPARLPIPQVVLRTLRRTAGVTLAEPTVSSAVVVGIAVGCLVFAVEVGLRVRQPLVEQFEGANPALGESLRTARDAVRQDLDSRMARRLYEDVLTDIKQASSVGLLDFRRVAVTVFLIVAVSIATIHLAVVGISLAGFGDGSNGDVPGGGTTSEYTGLQDGSSILGDPEDVPEGSEELDATIDTSGPGSSDGTDAESATAYEDSGFGGPESVESQRAGFTQREQVEEAELIREYNLRIRQETDDE